MVAKTTKPKSESRQTRAGVTLSVSRLEKALRRAHVGKRVGERSSIFLAGAMENVAEQVLEGAMACARDQKAKRVHPNHIIRSVRTDPDLARTFGGFAFSSLMESFKPIDYILPQEGENGQKERRKKLKQNKIDAAERLAKAREKKAEEQAAAAKARQEKLKASANLND